MFILWMQKDECMCKATHRLHTEPALPSHYYWIAPWLTSYRNTVAPERGEVLESCKFRQADRKQTVVRSMCYR